MSEISDTDSIFEMINNLNERLKRFEEEKTGWQCPNCSEAFDNLADFIEHIICNINDTDRRVKQLEADLENINIGATLDSNSQRISELEDWIEKRRKFDKSMQDMIKQFASMMSQANTSNKEASNLFGEMILKFIESTKPLGE